MSVVTSLVRPVVRPISSNLILPSRSQAFPSSGFLEAGYASPSQSLDGLIYGQEPFSGTQRSEQVGRWYEFDGTDDRLHNFSVTSSGAMTASWWAKRAGTGSIEIVFGYSVAGKLGYGTGDTLFARWMAGAATDTGALGIDTTEWHHICLVRNADDTGLVYVNGVPRDFDSGQAISGTATYDRIGVDETTNWYEGGLKNVGFWGRALTETEVRRLYTHPTEIDTTDLELFYDGEDTHPTIAYDRSGNGNDGTKTNITASTFHATSTVQSDCPFSQQNEVGFGYFMIKESGGSTYQAYRSAEQVTNGTLEQVFSTFGEPSSVISQLFGFSADASGNGFADVDYGFFTGGGDIRVYESGTIQYTHSGGYTEGDVLRIEKTGSTVVYKVNGTTVYTNSSATTDPVKVHGTAFHLNRVQAYPTLDGGIWTLDDDQNRWVRRTLSRDESDKTKAVYSQPLIYSGKAPANAQLKKSGCATFNGTTSYADGDTAAITGYPFTMMARVKPTGGSLGTVCALTDRDNSSYYYGFGYDNGDRVYIVFRNSVVQSHTENIELDESDAHLAVVFVSETRAKFYRNGVLLLDKSDFTSSSFWAGIDSYVVGCTRISSPTSFYDGAVWDFRLYDGEKTQSEILAISQGQSAYDQTNLAVGLPMEELGGSKHYDVSPNGSHADITALTESVHYGDTQDSFHYSRTKGFSDYVNYLAYSNGTTGWLVTAGITNTLEDGYQRIAKTDDLGSRSLYQQNATASAGVYSARFTVKAGTFDLCDFGIYDNSAWAVERVRIVSGSGTTSISGGLGRVSGLDSNDTVVEFQVTTTIADRTIYLYPGSAFTGGSGNHMFAKDWHVWSGAIEDRPSYVDTTGTAFYESNKPALADGSACAATGEAITNAAGSFFNNYPGGEVDLNPNVAPKRNNAVRDNLCPDDEFGASWGVAGTTVANTGYGEAPDGRYNAVQLENFNDAGGERFTEIATGDEYNGAKEWTFSCYMKGEGSNIGKLAYVFINRNSGTSGVFNAVGITLTADWQRIEVTQTMLSDTVGLKFGPYCAAADSTNASEVLIAMPKLEEWHEATPYIESDRASEDLPHDWEMPVNKVTGGLVLDSTAFWDHQNVATPTGGQSDPDGSTNGFLVTGSGGSLGRVQTTSAESYALVANTLNVVTVAVKAGTAAQTQVVIFNQAQSVNQAVAILDWSGGVPTLNSQSGEWSFLSDELTDGWYLLTMVWDCGSETTARVYLYNSSTAETTTTYYYDPQIARHYANPLFFREITQNGNLHRVDRLAFYNTVLTGARVDAVEQYTASTTV